MPGKSESRAPHTAAASSAGTMSIVGVLKAETMYLGCYYLEPGGAVAPPVPAPLAAAR